MKLKAVIEIPKGNDQRWHLDYVLPVIKNFGPIKDVIPVNDGKMPVAYGFLSEIFNHDEVQEGEQPENVDVIVFSNKEFSIGEEVEVTIFGMIERSDHDHKILAHDDTVDIQSWEDITPTERKLLVQFFGYKHPIITISSREVAEEYIARVK